MAQRTITLGTSVPTWYYLPWHYRVKDFVHDVSADDDVATTSLVNSVHHHLVENGNLNYFSFGLPVDLLNVQQGIQCL